MCRYGLELWNTNKALLMFHTENSLTVVLEYISNSPSTQDLDSTVLTSHVVKAELCWGFCTSKYKLGSVGYRYGLPQASEESKVFQGTFTRDYYRSSIAGYNGILTQVPLGKLR